MGCGSEPTGTEGRVLAAAAGGAELDLRVGDPELDDPSNSVDWGEARIVRAEFPYDLCVGTHGEWRVHARGLRLRGARIIGELNFEAASAICPLTFRDCWFDDPLVLSLARLVTLRLTGCHLPGIIADQLETRGNIDLNNGFHAYGEVLLLGAHIGGWLDCAGATFANPGGRALTADQLTVKQSVFCRDGFQAYGEVRLNAVHIGVALECDGATFANPDGYALNCDKARVEQSMLCRDGFHAQGEVCLNGAHIGSALECDGGTFANPNGSALYADGLTVDQNMLCRAGFRACGEVRLVGGHIGGTLDCTGLHQSLRPLRPKRPGVGGRPKHVLHQGVSCRGRSLPVRRAYRRCTGFRPRDLRQLQRPCARRAAVASSQANGGLSQPDIRAGGAADRRGGELACGVKTGRARLRRDQG